MIHNFVEKTKICLKLITYIQKTYRVKLRMKEARVEIVINYWDKVIGKCMYAAIKKND